VNDWALRAGVAAQGEVIGVPALLSDTPGCAPMAEEGTPIEVARRFMQLNAHPLMLASRLRLKACYFEI
jgi:hypothetical protein